MNKQSEIHFQRHYYSETADKYDELHLLPEDEHYFALCFLVGMIDNLGVKSILDVGSGTGRAINYIKQQKRYVRVVGIEPVREMREIGYRKGIPKSNLISGDATAIAFSNGAFDLVSEFGVLHHIKTPHIAIHEMLRVAKKAIFLSDSNNFGQGSLLKRTIKQIINAMGLWKVAVFINTRGKGYTLSEGDGLAYSYSVFNNYQLIRRHCKSVHILNTKDGDINPYRSAGHVAILARKQ